jgi:hypothetical protein
MPSMVLPTRRGRRARGSARLALAVALALLAGLVGPAQAQVGIEVGVTKFHTPTWGTNHIDGTPFSARVWDILVDGDTAYISGEFTALAPTVTLAGAIDGSSGQPQPGFPTVDDGQVNVAVADGRGGWFVGGSFQKINGMTKNGLAHILADGSIDANWEPSLVGPVNQPSGSFTVWGLAVAGPWVYVGGEFTKFGPKGGVPSADRNHIARVGVTTGTVDRSWDPNADRTVRSIAVSPDGSRVYYAGDFTTVSGAPRAGAAATWGAGPGNGTLINWQPPVAAPSAVATSPDSSRVFVGGANALAAYDANGAQLWNVGVGGGKVASLATSRDGSVVYAGGQFTSAANQPRNRLAAFDAGSGAIDSSWNPGADGGVSAVTVSDDGTKVYVGGIFNAVRGQERHNLAAVDPTGALDTWNPNANGAVSALSASGAQVYAGGAFKGLGAVPRTYLAAINVVNGGPTGFAPLIQNLDSTNQPKAGQPPLVQTMALSADHQRLYIGGIFSHVGGVPRANVAAINLATGQVDPTFDPGEPQGAVRSILLRDNNLFIGGDFDTIQIKSTQKGRPDNNASCGTTPGSSLNGNRCVWQRSKLAILNAANGVLDTNFNGPVSTGPGLVGQGGKLCQTNTTQACGTGAIKSIQVSADGQFIYLAGTFSSYGGQLGLLSLYLTGPSAGQPTPWQASVDRPIYDMKLGPDGKVYATGGGAGGRLYAFTPQVGAGKMTPTWNHLFDGDATALSTSATAVYNGGHYDFVDGGAFKRKHASAYDLNGNLAMNFDPEMDTSEGVFSVEVVPDRMVIYGGNFSRVNRRPQPGYAQFAGRP